MNDFLRLKLNETINSTLSAMGKLKENEPKIHGDAKGHDEFLKKYEDFLKVIDTFKNLITEEDSPKEIKMEIWEDIKALEGPAQRKNREEKALALQNSLFWEKLYSLKETLTDLQDTRLKRGRKVEKIDPTAEGDKQ